MKKATRLEEAEAEIELLRTQFEEAEENFNLERENLEALLQKSQNDIVSLVKDFEIFNIQLLEKDEQVNQLIETKDQLKNLIADNEMLKNELQVQYEKLNERNDQLDENKKEISTYQRKLVIKKSYRKSV